MNSIVVISNPVSATNRSSEASLSKFVQIVASSGYPVEVIAGNLSNKLFDDNAVTLYNPARIKSSHKLANLVSNICFQLKAMFYTMRCVKRNNPVFFWIADGMIGPFWVARIKRAAVYYFVYGNCLKIGGAVEKATYKRISRFANSADYVCAENSLVFNEWGDEIKNQNRRIVHLYTDAPLIDERKPQNIFGAVCRLAPGKHVSDMILAFDEFQKAHQDWKLEIVGSGVLYDDCTELVNRLGISDKVTLYGWLDKEKLNEVMLKWKYLLFPSDTEGLPNTVLEAMSFAIPCIASPVGAIPDIVNENNGYLLDGTSPETLCAKMEQAVSNENYLEMSRSARQTICDRFSFVTAVENFTSVLNNI